MRVLCSPGDGLAVVTPGAVVILDSATPLDRVREVWGELFEQRRDPAELLGDREVLALVIDGETGPLAASEPGLLSVDGDEQPLRRDALTALPRCRIVIGGPTQLERSLPVSAGVTPIGSVVIDWDSEPLPAAAQSEEPKTNRPAPQGRTLISAIPAAQPDPAAPAADHVGLDDTESTLDGAAATLDGAADTVTAIDDAAASTRASAPSAELGDHDGFTISDTQAAALLEADTVTVGAVLDAELPRTDSGSRVASLLCEQGHVQRPGGSVCSRCRSPLSADSLEERQRPEFAFAVLPSGERIPLGRGAVFGRRPRSSRMQGVRVPHLVTLSSPHEDISRSHLEITIEDWSVLATDLDSTNGTMLLRDNQAPVRLRPGVATNLVHGDRLDLGDGVVLTLEEV